MYLSHHHPSHNLWQLHLCYSPCVFVPIVYIPRGDMEDPAPITTKTWSLVCFSTNLSPISTGTIINLHFVHQEEEQTPSPDPNLLDRNANTAEISDGFFSCDAKIMVCGDAPLMFTWASAACLLLIGCRDPLTTRWRTIRTCSAALIQARVNFPTLCA